MSNGIAISSMMEAGLLEQTIQKAVCNSELIVEKNKRTFLTYPANGLALCKLEEMEDSINFIFDTNEMNLAEVVLQRPKWEKLRFLFNCAALEYLSAEYEYSMSLDNLLVDVNLMPQILIRDAKPGSGIPFEQTYKALIGSVLLPKYKYEDYISGGQDYYKKNKLLAEIVSLENTSAIRERLFEEYHNLMQEMAVTKKLVNKKNVWVSLIVIPLLAVSLAVVTFFAGRMLFLDIPFRDSVIAANTAYINSNFLGVQHMLRDYDISVLSVDTRYFLSRSYVSTEALTEMQRANILVGLAQRTDPIIFDYWILLGRLQFAEAVDIALRLGDDELLLFAYLKQEVFVRQDMTIPGDERAALLSYLERNIDRLNTAREQAMSNILGSQ